MRISNTTIFGFEPAIRGMRNARTSHEKSDSTILYGGCPYCIGQCKWPGFNVPENPTLGPKDLKLATSLVKAGSSHAKFTRLIVVYIDLQMARYAWTDLDTYRVGTVRLSESSAWKIKHGPLREKDFENKEVLPETLKRLAELSLKYQDTGSLETIKTAKKVLPEAFLQLSTVMLNYQVCRAIYFDRQNHLLDEFNKNSEMDSICKWIETLPYSKELILAK